MKPPRLLPRLLLPMALLLAAGCASPPPPPTPPSLLADGHFGPPAEAVQVDDLFQVSEPMRVFLRTQLQRGPRAPSKAGALVDALNADTRIRLDYDASRTRNAAEAFRDGRGNCLSLLLMAAALARELGLEVSFYSARLEDSWSRSDRLLVASGHVNLGLGRAPPGSHGHGHELLIDFLPAAQLRGLVLDAIDETTVVVLFMNNRAVEALRAGDLDSAYAWARGALLRRGHQPHALNTLGVVYLRRGLAAQAERVFDTLLQREPAGSTMHRSALANQVLALQALGRSDEAQALQQRLARLEPLAPYQAFDEGRAALQRGDLAQALHLLQRELAKDPGNAEFRHWLGLALWASGDTAQAQRELQRAAQDGSTPQQRALYHAKLERLRAATAAQ